MIIVLTILRFATLYMIFGKLHHPNSKLKQAISYLIMAAELPIALFIGANFAHTTAPLIVESAIILLLGLLCLREGDRSRPINSALYAYAMFMMISFSTSGYGITFFGFDYGILPDDVFTAIQQLLCLLWAVFYYHVAKKMPASMPLAFSLLIILMPVIAFVIEIGIVNNVKLLVEEETGQLMTLQSGLFLYSGQLSMLIIAANMFAFYLYVRLSVTYESLRFAQELAQTPPVWTAEDGLSEPFINKYQITPREQQVIEILLLGKTDKEISQALDLAVNTVQAHLKHIYRKTDTSGRFALIALVRG
ncbi:MAG: helix-turn-helix transcriptional regulator [Deferribacteraceae bacterium]|jgi:DNA-binding CsgD family transcriptional regulator|nr:helix-turn-helix transcriptional regulator [Deferribacteraceae bacterium]